jgi:hypothetical protein
MNEKMISVTDAARHFADCVNRVHYQNMTFFCSKTARPWLGWCLKK